LDAHTSGNLFLEIKYSYDEEIRMLPHETRLGKQTIRRNSKPGIHFYAPIVPTLNSGANSLVDIPGFK
jgi:hypothetical protein